MSKAFLIPPTDDLIEEVVARLLPEGSDYSRNLILFPGKRPAHFVRKLLGAKVGHAFMPPQVFSIDSFVDYIYAEVLGRARRQLQPIDAVALLHELYRESTNGSGETGFADLDDFLPLGLKLFGEIEELRMANVPTRQLDEALSAVSVGGRLRLSRIYKSFYHKVDQLGCTTRSLKYSEVADSLSEDHLSNFSSIIVAGFFALTDAEKTIFMKLRRMESVVFLFQEGKGLEKHLKELALTPETTSAGRVSASQNEIVHFYQSPDSHGQVLGLTGLMQERVAGGSTPDERTVIVLPASESLLPLYHQTLALLEDGSYNISLGYPVARTPVYGFLQSLMGLVGSMLDTKFHAPEYIKFVLHPYAKNILIAGRPDVTRILFHAIEERFAGEKSLTYFRLEELEEDVPFFTEVAQRVLALGVECSAEALKQHLTAIHGNTIRRLAEAKSIGAMAQACIDTLVYIDEQSTARRHPLFRPYVETLIESLDGIRLSMLADASFTDPARAMAFLSRCLSVAQVPFPGTPLNGLQVLGFLETRNLRFDTVFMLDVNEDTIPGAGRDQTLIPQSIREQVGLPTSHQREEIAAYYFDVLIQGAREVHLFFSENAQKEKSRLVEELIWERQQRDAREDTRDYIRTIGYQLSLSNSLPESVAKSDDMVAYLRQVTYHATALDTYLHCPLRFYYSYVLGLREKEEVAGDIESSDVGSFVHEILRTYFEEKIGKRLTPKDLDVARLSTIVDEQFPLQFGVEQTGAKHLLRRQILKQLARFITEYQVPLCSKGTVTLLELESKIPRLLKNGFIFSGKIDRVEKRGDKIFILDYKTGGDEKKLKINLKKLDVGRRETWSEAIGSLQLPMYMMLYAEGTKTPVQNLVSVYLLLGRNKMDEKIEVRLFDDGVDVQEMYRALEQIIFSLLEEIVNPTTAFAPTNDIQGHCPYCPFTTMCGTGWVKRPAF